MHRRLGRSVNHDSCDGCKEGGDLICCDRCPAAFHLNCHDPPLSEDDLPSGDWLCHRCITTSEVEECAPSSDPVVCAMEEDPVNESEPLLWHPTIISEVDESLSVHFFKSLMGQQTVKNPAQYQVPNELAFAIQFPGSSKKGRSRDNKYIRRYGQESDSGIVHLPSKLCHQCKKSCHKAPLIQCDYCSLLFHADCLSPPLRCLPVGRWMCPNHTENFVDQKLLTSVCISERVKHWDRFSGLVSQDAMRLKFIKRSSRHHPLFRQKARLSPRKDLMIPKSVEQVYKRPNGVLPRVKDSLPFYGHSSLSFISSEFSSVEEKETWFSNVMLFQTSVIKQIFLHQNSSQISIKCDTSDANCETPFHENKLSACNSNLFHNNKMCTAQNGPNHESVTTNGELLTVDSKVRCENHNSNSSHHPHQLSTCKYSVANKVNNMSVSSRIITKNSLKNQSSLNNQCPCPSLKIHQNKPLSSSIHFGVNNSISMKSSSQDKFDLELSKLDDKLIRLLALQRLQQIYSKKKCKATVEKINGDSSTDVPVEVRCRANICPLEGRFPPVPMCYRSLHMGLSVDNDVCFSNYGHCNYLSSKHASIFYDEITKRYELINYSSHGTVVDNIFYCFDTSDKRHNSSSTNSLSAQVRKLSRSSSRMNNLPSPIPSTQRHVVPSRGRQNFQPCKCRANPFYLSEGNGFENSALLNHGSFIQCGCLNFIFSITECGFKIENQKNDTS